jgi:CBS domain-containing protein
LDTPVREIMTPGVLTISESASLRQVHRALSKHGVHAVLVVGASEGRPLGWVTSRGLLGWIERDATIASARDAITERPEVIGPSATARDALVALSQPGVTHLLVCHRPDGSPEGVVSELDLVALGGG